MISHPVDDDAVEAWFHAHKEAGRDLPEEALAAIALWFPIVGISVNDNEVGALGLPS